MVGCGGFVFCLSLWYTKSLWWAIGFHAGWDWGQSYLYGTPDSGLLTQGHLRVSHSAGNRLLSGGATGPEGSLLILPLLIVSDRDVDLVGSPKKCVVATMVLRENQLIH